MRLFCATLFPFILILSTACLVLQSSCNKVHLRATTTSTHRSVTVHFHCMQNLLSKKRLLFCVQWKKNVTEDWNNMGSRELSRIRFMGFLLLTTRGHPLTTWTLALHYCCTSPQTTIPTIHCTDDTHSWLHWRHTQLIALTTHTADYTDDTHSWLHWPHTIHKSWTSSSSLQVLYSYSTESTQLFWYLPCFLD